MDSLAATEMVNSDHPDVIAFTTSHIDASKDARSNAIALYYAIRDGFRYDPYTIDLSVDGMRATSVLDSGRGWCVTKATLLAACCRVANIPARLGYADVRNHLSTEKMRAEMGTNLFVWHGYTAILLDDVWVKATPAFNLELCEKFRLRALEFDGYEDSIYHPFDLDGREHMEYVRFHGEFDDVPLEEMRHGMHEAYPGMFETEMTGDFDAEVARETSA